MENVPQVVFPISPTGIMGGDKANIDVTSCSSRLFSAVILGELVE